jgi:hypothetical protein
MPQRTKLPDDFFGNFPVSCLSLAYFFDSWRLGQQRLADCIANSDPKIAKRHDYTRKINDLTFVSAHL